MKIVFCGNPAFAVPALESLLRSHHSVRAVVCSPDKPRGRGQKIEPLPVKQLAQSAAIPVLQPESLKDEEFLSQIRVLAPDCLVVIAFRILPRELFALPRLGSFNVHPSLLPRGRGPAPIRWTLLRGESETGVTIIQLSEKVDAGGMLRQERVPVGADEDFGSLHDRLSILGARMLVEVLDAFERGEPPPPIVQDESQLSKAPKLFATDRVLDWSQPAQAVFNRIRAFSPQPGAIGESGNFRLKILEAEMSSDKQMAPGQIQAQNSDLWVGTRDGAVRLNLVQPEGRRPMSAEEYLRGRPKLPAKFESHSQE